MTATITKEPTQEQLENREAFRDAFAGAFDRMPVRIANTPELRRARKIAHKFRQRGTTRRHAEHGVAKIGRNDIVDANTGLTPDEFEMYREKAAMLDAAQKTTKRTDAIKEPVWKKAKFCAVGARRLEQYGEQLTTRAPMPLPRCKYGRQRIRDARELVGAPRPGHLPGMSSKMSQAAVKGLPERTRSMDSVSPAASTTPGGLGVDLTGGAK